MNQPQENKETMSLLEIAKIEIERLTTIARMEKDFLNPQNMQQKK